MVNMDDTNVADYKLAVLLQHSQAVETFSCSSDGHCIGMCDRCLYVPGLPLIFCRIVLMCMETFRRIVSCEKLCP